MDVWFPLPHERMGDTVNWEGVTNHFLKVCIGMRVLTAYMLFLGKFWSRLLSKGKPLGILLFLITIQIQLHKLHSHRVFGPTVTALCLRPLVKADLPVYAFSVHC